MKIENILKERKIRSEEGSIDSSQLDSIIRSAIKHYDTDIPLEKVRVVVIDDYKDSDISKVTTHDVIEIIDASGFE